MIEQEPLEQRRLDPLVVDDMGVTLRPDPGRTVVRFFVPGNEDVGPGDSRAAPVIDRVLRLSDEEVSLAMRDIEDRFATRHPSLNETFERHTELIAGRLDVALSDERRRLLGAAFTHEYAIEGAALCNPSIVAHPQQPVDGELAIVLSVRGIGEGHRSSIGFRSGTVDATGALTIDVAAPFAQMAPATTGVHHGSVLRRRLAELHDDHENAAFVIDPLPERFEDAQLRTRIDALRADAATRRHTDETIANLEHLAESSYRVHFPPGGELSGRVLWPHAQVERHGMEDARFVEITDGSAPRYCATYTAFDGAKISQNLLTTEDFSSFTVTPMAGDAARGKGLALFPRMIAGRYAALTRADRETNSIAFSHDVCCWDDSQVIQAPRRPWEVLQLGNCGSPIETADGWLVLTHGVGPMRTYSIGAMLLDLDDPTRVIASSDRPILSPGRGQQSGYVPNVVYSCGALAVGDRLVLPYGVGDQIISFASLSISDLLDEMRRSSHPQPRRRP